MLLTVPEVAPLLGLKHRRRVYNLIRAGVLPAVRLGRQVRVDEDALRDFIKAGGRALPPHTTES